MSYFDAANALVGNRYSYSIDAGIEMKNNEELYQIAQQTQNSYLLHQVIINQMYVHCYFREYLTVAGFGEKYRMHTGMNTGARRLLDFYVIFFEGICK